MPHYKFLYYATQKEIILGKEFQQPGLFIKISRRCFMRIFLWLMVFAALIVGFGGIQEVIAECEENKCIGKITRLYLNKDAQMLYILTDGDESKLNCLLTDGGYIRLSPEDNPFFDEMYSMLLAALVSEKQMWVRTNADGKACFVQYVVIEQ
jgi:hypothetical protein